MSRVSERLVAMGALAIALLAPLGNTSLGLILALMGVIGLAVADPRVLLGRLRRTIPRSMVALLALIVVNIAFSTNPALSAATGIGYGMVMLVSFMAADKVVRSDERLQRWVRRLFVLGSYAGTLYSIYDYHTLHRGRAVAAFTWENQLGTLSTTILFITLGHLLSPSVSKRERLLSSPLLPLAVYTLLLSQSRGGIVGLAAGIMVLCLADRQSQLVGGLATLAAGIAVRFSPGLYARLTSTPQTEINGQRMLEWRATVRMIGDHPVFGIGAGTYPAIYPSYKLPQAIERTLSFAHNLPLQLAAELGLPGLAVFSWLVYDVLRSGFALAKRDWLARGITTALVAFLAHDLFDCIVYGADMGGLFWTLGGILIAMQSFCRESSDLA